jgi:glucose/arabinose dehydrogenase
MGRWWRSGTYLKKLRTVSPEKVAFTTFEPLTPIDIATIRKLLIMVLLSNTLAIMAVLGLASAVPELEKRACPAIAPAVKPVMTSGYTATVIMKGLKTPREMVFDPLGNLLVVQQGGGGLVRVVLTDNGGLDVCSASSKTLVADATVYTTFSFPLQTSL